MKFLILAIVGISLVILGVRTADGQVPDKERPDIQNTPPPVFQPVQPPPGRPAPPPIPEPPYIPQDIENVIETAKRAKPYFQSGGVWITRAPGGEIEIKAAVIYRGVAIAELKFNPLDGTVLPRGFNPHVFKMKVNLDSIRNRAVEVIKNLEILNGAEFREPEWAWAVPVAYRGKIVAHIKVRFDGSAIVPDYRLDQEMRYYVR